jgi:methylenetetrahydrofolate reductase (NADPH)
MRLKDIYASGPALSIEFFPPKSAEVEVELASRIPGFQALRPAFVTVTYGAGGSSRERTLGWARRLRQEFGFDVLCHLTCVGQSRAEVAEVLSTLEADGIDKIIALRGDPPKGVTNWQPHPEGYHHSVELVQAAVARGFSVAVAGFPEVHPEAQDAESDIRFLAQKVAAGAESVTTQLFYDNEDYWNFVERAKAAGVHVPIVPGILPFRSVSEIRRFTAVYARTKNGPARIPDHLEARLSAAEGDPEAEMELGIAYATEQVTELLRQGAPGIHFYCLNESRAVEQILERLMPQLPQDLAVGLMRV